MDLQMVESFGGMVRAAFDARGKLGVIRADSIAQLLEYLKNGTFIFEDAGIKL